MRAKAQAAMIFFFFFLCFGFRSEAQANGVVFDVTRFGGKVDITQAIVAAFRRACDAPGLSKVLVPKGVYDMGQINMIGPCRGDIHVEVQGTIRAYADPEKGKGSWIRFYRINKFSLSGGGIFDGNGMSAWARNDCNRNPNCANLPISLRFDFITNAIIHGVTSLNSKNFHINILGCENLTLSHLNIKAPANSPNTDGIHIGRSNRVNITHSIVGTGDDCISVGDGTRNLNVRNVSCGPGHGISVGSLGRYPKEEPVSGIIVKNCTFQGTENGVRIKTWPASLVEITVTDLSFEDIILKNVSNPILIDQEYCPWNQCKHGPPSKIKISHVKYNNIHGTAFNKDAIKLICSSAARCQNIEVGEINIAYQGKDGPPAFYCKNVKPILSGHQKPAACSSPLTM